MTANVKIRFWIKQAKRYRVGGRMEVIQKNIATWTLLLQTEQETWILGYLYLCDKTSNSFTYVILCLNTQHKNNIILERWSFFSREFSLKNKLMLFFYSLLFQRIQYNDIFIDLLIMMTIVGTNRSAFFYKRVVLHQHIYELVWIDHAYPSCRFSLSLVVHSVISNFL